MPADPRLVELFGSDKAQEMANIIGMNPEINDVLVNISNQLNISATVFAEKLEKQAGMLLGNGLAIEAVKSNIAKDMQAGGRIFGEMQNAIKGELAELTNQSGRIVQ